MSRAPTVEFVDVRTGKVLDVIRLSSDGLRYDTGRAGDVVATESRRFKLEPAAMYDRLAEGWSNGYVATRRGPAAAGR